jgi:hypothetical protein
MTPPPLRWRSLRRGLAVIVTSLAVSDAGPRTWAYGIGDEADWAGGGGGGSWLDHWPELGCGSWNELAGGCEGAAGAGDGCGGGACWAARWALLSAFESAVRSDLRAQTHCFASSDSLARWLCRLL